MELRVLSRPLTRAATAILVTVGAAALAPSAQAAITANVAFGQLNVTGDADNNTISVEYRSSGDKYVVFSPTGIAPGPPAAGEASAYCVQAVDGNQVTDPNRIVCDRRPSVSGFLVRIDGLGGTDTLVTGYGASPWRPADPNQPPDGSRLDGGPGNDLLGGSPGPDTLLGGPNDDGLDGAAGDDTLFGGTTQATVIVAGSDRLFGGPGSDDLEDGDEDDSTSADEMDGGVCTVSPCPGTGTEGATDQDFVLYDRRDVGVVVNLAQQAGNGRTGENDVLRNFEGTLTGAGADQVTGNARENLAFTGAGNDTIDVSGDVGSEDTAMCGDGTDTLAKDADDTATDCETTNDGGGTPGGGGGTPGGGGGGTTGGGTTTGGTTSGGGTTTGGGTPPAAAPDTTGPAIVASGNSTLTASNSGGFGFGLGPFAEDATGSVAIKSAPVSASRAGAAAKKVVLNLGRKSFTAAAGKKVTVRFKLSAKHRKILAKRKKIRMTATIVAQDKAGNATTKKVSFTLKAPRKR